MTAFASYVIVAWVVLAVCVFPSFAPRRGVLVVLFSGVLFLPELGTGVVELGPIKFSKYNAVCYALLLSTLLFDADRLFAVTPSWMDLPVMVWCGCPAVSVLLNDPPPDGGGVLRDAASQVLGQTTLYLIPYWVGRAYFSDAGGLRELAAGTVVAGLVYVPFCLYEVRMSPQLHTAVYGYTVHNILQQVRFGGFRPVVFLPNGLVVALFIATATVLAAWARGAGVAAGRQRAWAVWVLAPTLILCKSVGAIVLAGVGIGLLGLTRLTSMRAGLLVLAAVPPAYCVARTSGAWKGNELVELSAENVNEERAESLGFRLNQEEQLIARALERPAFGWGGWGRNRVMNARGKDTSVTDGLWIIILGTYGIVGLTAFGATVLVPVVRYARTVPAVAWPDPTYAAATGCAVVLGLWCVDSLFNAAIYLQFLVMAGGLARFRPEGYNLKTSAK